MAKNTGDVGVYYNVLGAALQIHGAKVNRQEFLAKEFGKYCNPETIEKILKEGTVKAGVEVTLMDKIADEAIGLHTGIASSLSFASGIPGGLAMFATVPADIAQYYYHVIVIAQKLAYIYGLAELGIVDDDFKSLLTLLVGVMTEDEDANRTITEIFSSQVSKEVVAISLGKAFNKTILKIATALAYRLTGKSVFKSIWKAIPIIGGVVSGGITLFTFQPMCNKLKARLHKSIETANRKEIVLSKT
ncbi:MAG: hypothetical protein LBE74_02000 [Treponema sp.]|jgi:hypothetical protein|nr:hypothetical protein [Treponema sp.]